MKITKRVREEAALLCAMAASSQPLGNTWDAQYLMFGDYEYSPAGELARLALSSVSRRFQGAEAYAEAEAMLRTGWKP